MHLHDVCDIITSNVGAVLPVVALSILVNHKKKRRIRQYSVTIDKR